VIVRGVRTLRTGAVAALVSALGFCLWAAAAGAETRSGGTAQWSAGQGDCGVTGVGQAGNGTGFIAAFPVPAEVVVDGNALSVTFVDNGNAVFSPVTGEIRDDGNFTLEGRKPEADEDYRYEGKAEADRLQGTFTRLAHYQGRFPGDITGPRCTATWNVVVPLSSPIPLPTRPRTVERPPGGVSTEEGAGEDDGSAGFPAWLLAALGALAIAGAVGGWVYFTKSKEPKPAPEEPEEPEDDEDDLGFPPEEIGGQDVDVVPPVAPQTKERCTCSCSAAIVGPDELRMGDPDITWTLRPTEFGERSPDITLVGTSPDPNLLKKTGVPPIIEATYVVDVSAQCTGGGQADEWRTRWEIVNAAADHLNLRATVTGQAVCPDGGRHSFSCIGIRSVLLTAHCGPDITDQFLFAADRIVLRLRQRQATRSDGVSFMLGNLRWLTFRPYVRGRWNPGGCPSCRRCGDTATIFGKCVDLWYTDSLLYGMIGGVLGVEQAIVLGGGLVAKAFNLHLNDDTFSFAAPAWSLGYGIGDYLRSSPGETVSRATTAGVMFYIALLAAPPRPECGPCLEQVTITGSDWSSYEWFDGASSIPKEPAQIYDTPPKTK
jgi:hypothetical protein